MERWDAYDAAGNRLDMTLVRGEPIPEGVYHLVSCIVVQHTDGDLLLMKRSPMKEHYPNILVPQIILRLHNLLELKTQVPYFVQNKLHYNV